MSKQIAVSFESGYAKVSYGSQRNGTLVITRTFTVKEDEFDAFLAREKTKDFIVLFSFQTFYQDVLLLPRVEMKYVDTLIEAEIKKNAPELKNFVFFSTILKEKVHEGRPVRETFVFAVDSTEINPILERFSRFGKRVKRLYADVFVLSCLVVGLDNVKDKTAMCMIDKGDYKTLFLVREGKLTFVRSIQSRGRGIDRYDVTNVNMTVNYARQTLREHPEELIIVNTAKDEVSTVEGLTLPTTIFRYPPGVMATGGDITGFVIPVAGLFLGKGHVRESLLPKLYQRVVSQEHFMRYASVAFVIVSLLCLGYIISGWNQVRQIRGMIDPIKAEIGSKRRVYEELESRNKDLQAVLPYINYLNAESAKPDIQKALATLQILNRDKVRVEEIEIINPGEELTIRVKGHITANTYGDLQSCFRKLADDMKSAKSGQVLIEKLDLTSKDFNIETTWKH
ncbi:MAG TPA: hypothetical protein PK125_03430 [Syntrophorhabdus sp.]|nr:hypothetical protein [Syntrophorhabdus sp.]